MTEQEKLIAMLAHANAIATRILETLEKQGDTLDRIAKVVAPTAEAVNQYSAAMIAGASYGKKGE